MKVTDWNRTRILCSTIAFVLLVLGATFSFDIQALAQTSGDDGPLAELTLVIGQVELQAGGQGDWTSVSQGQPLFMGDRIRTGHDSRAVVLFTDSSQVRMTELTTLEISPRFETEEEARGVAARVRLFLGKIFNRVNPQESSLEFESPDALAAVRGTDFSMEAGTDGSVDTNLLGQVDFETWRTMHRFRTRLVVAQGLVAFINPFDTVEVGEGEASDSSSTTPPTDPVPAQDDELDEISQAFSDEEIDETDDPSEPGAPDEAAVGVPSDTTPPVVIIDTPPMGEEVQGWVVFRGSALDPNLVEWTLRVGDNEPFAKGVTPDVEAVLDTTQLDDGPYTVYLEAVDALGNRSQTSVSIIVSNFESEPELKILEVTVEPKAFSPELGHQAVFSAFLSKSAPWRVDIIHVETEEDDPLQAGLGELIRTFQGDGDQIQVAWDGSGSDDLTNVVFDGVYFFVLEAEDATADQVVSESVFVIVDTQPPVVSNTVPEPGETLDHYPKLITVSLSEVGSGIDFDSVDVWVNDIQVPFEMDEDPYTVFITEMANELVEGTNEIGVRARDLAGNAVQYSWEFMIDTTEPKVLEVTAEPGAFSPILGQKVNLSAALSVEADWMWAIIYVEDPEGLEELWMVESFHGHGKDISYQWDGKTDPSEWEPWELQGSPGGGSVHPTQADGIYRFMVAILAEDGKTFHDFSVASFIRDTNPPYVLEASLEDGDEKTDVSEIETIIIDEWTPVDVDKVFATLNYEVVKLEVTVSNDSDHDNGRAVLAVAKFDEPLEDGNYTYHIVFDDELGNKGLHAINFSVVSPPPVMITDIEPRRIALSPGNEKRITVFGENLIAGAKVHMSRLDGKGTSAAFTLHEDDISSDGKSAELTLNLNDAWVESALFRVYGFESPIDKEDQPRLLITRTDATSDDSSLTLVRNDLGRSGAGSGPGGIQSLVAEQIMTGIGNEANLLLTADEIVVRTPDKLEFRSLDPNAWASFIEDLMGSGQWAPALAVFDGEPWIYFFDPEDQSVRWMRVDGSGYSQNKVELSGWTAVNDLLVHEGLLIVSGEVGGATRVVTADAWTGQEIRHEIVSVSGVSKLAIFDGGLGGDSVLLVYDETGIYAFDLYTLESLWSRSWNGVTPETMPVVAVDQASEYVYTLVHLNGRPSLFAYHARTGNPSSHGDWTGKSDTYFHEEGLAVSHNRAILLGVWKSKPTLFSLVLGDEMPIPLIDGPVGAFELGPVALSPTTGHAYAVVHYDYGESGLFTVDLNESPPVVERVPLGDYIDLPHITTMKVAQGALWAIINGDVYRMSYDNANEGAYVDPPLLKTANRSNAQIGDVITYTITFDNTRLIDDVDELVRQSNVWIEDVLPAGFVYVEGSSYIYPNGVGGSGQPVQVADPVGGRTLYWELATPADPIEVGTRRSLTYQVIVGPRTMEGAVHTNRALGFADGNGDGVYSGPCPTPDSDPVAEQCDLALTNVARADVYVTTSVFTPQTYIVGKVFYDIDGDGHQSPGEPGIEGVRIVTQQGIIVTTDENGMFHLSNSSPGRHVLKLDKNTLPAGWKVTGQGATRLLDTALGGLYTVNFVVEGE